MAIRELGIGDHPAILDLWRRAGLSTLRPDGRDGREAFARQLATGCQTVLGLEEDGVLTGVVVANHDGRKGWISRLAVDPDARREGRARRLITAAEATRRSRGIQVLAALIEEENEASVRLFEEAGYSIGQHILYLSKRESEDA